MVPSLTCSDVAEALVAERLALRGRKAPRACYSVLNAIAFKLGPKATPEQMHQWLMYVGVPRIDAAYFIRQMMTEEPE